MSNFNPFFYFPSPLYFFYFILPFILVLSNRQSASPTHSLTFSFPLSRFTSFPFTDLHLSLITSTLLPYFIFLLLYFFSFTIYYCAFSLSVCSPNQFFRIVIPLLSPCLLYLIHRLIIHHVYLFVISTLSTWPIHAYSHSSPRFDYLIFYSSACVVSHTYSSLIISLHLIHWLSYSPFLLTYHSPLSNSFTCLQLPIHLPPPLPGCSPIHCLTCVEAHSEDAHVCIDLFTSSPFPCSISRPHVNLITSVCQLVGQSVSVLVSRSVSHSQLSTQPVR